jgi:hypothetical protein
MHLRRARFWRGAGPVSAAATVLALAAAIVPAQAATRPGTGNRLAAAVDGVQAGQPDDMLLTGLGDTRGYHLYLARYSGGYAWQPLATLAPGGVSGEPWTGRQCLTGDGKTAIAMVAPWHTVNSAAGSDRGATAVAVDLATGHTRVLATGVATYYFNPGCGTGGDVTLTRYLGADEQTTQVLDLDAATGKVLSRRTVDGEITGAVPAGSRVYALRGNQVVQLGAAGAAPVVTVPQTPVTLAPGSSGLDVLATDRAHGSTVWRWSAGTLRKLGQGGLSTRLFTGSTGITVTTGASLGRASGARALPAAGGGATLGVSTLGDLTLAAPAKKTGATGDLPRILDAGGAVVRPAVTPAVTARLAPFTAARPTDPAAAAPATATAVTAPTATALPAGPGHPGSRSTASAARAAATGTTTPACAVSRTDLNIQVPQPTNSQIDWAAQLAVQGSLPGRAAGFDNLPGGYAPEYDFPVPVLHGGGGRVPAVLVEAIMAQESNMDQASWHVPAGMPGDPLIADYYGNAGDTTSPINYGSADCGYGLGQITDIMFAGAYSPAVQQRVAVDYAENAAAVVKFLADKWNQLYDDGITVNDANPSYVESWYDAIWAYNSGIQPNAANGNTTGCTPGPSCTDSAGNWGLGWANNPINPVYPAGREPFLNGPNGYADAATPGDWPYQERVFGWMHAPLLRWDPGTGQVQAAYIPTTSVVAAPPAATFCNSSDNCIPSDPTGQFCQDNNLHCWYHQAVQIGCSANACNTDPPGTAVPTTTDVQPPACSPDTAALLPPTTTSVSTTTIVTDEALPQQNPGNYDINLVGCSAGTSADGWSEGGTFSLSNVWDASGNPLPGQEDVHQLGAGFGGHMWFDHEVSKTDTASTVTAAWAPDLTTASTGAGIYRIYVFVPPIGATATAVYTVNENYPRPSGAPSSFQVTVNQNNASGWVDIGAYYLRPGANVTLTNNTDSTGNDLAINAVAFTRLTQDSNGPSYVAIGDSATAGEGAGGWDPATDQARVNMCHRSSLTYSALDWASNPITYTGGYALAACSGATSDNLEFTDQETQPPQYAALSSSTSLVTVTIGINDLHFADIMSDCVLSLTGCLGDSVTSPLDSELTNPADTNYVLNRLESDYSQIHEEAPSAKIVVLTYPDIFPAHTNVDCSGLSALDINWLQGEYIKFTDDIATAVNTEAAAFIPISLLDESSAFTGHDICSDSHWEVALTPDEVVSAALPWIGDHVKQTFFHPNAAGYSQEAQDLTTYRASHGL